MDLGGMNLVLIEIVGAALLGLALLYMVMRTRSRGKQDNSPEVEAETRKRYADEERARKDGTEGID